ncbi:hypothetical protein GJO05_15890 [Escherichia coli]|nr:hypothetical protein [Escherichia coli]
MCEQGMPRFVMAYIDIRLGRFICSSSAWNITDHVLRYLILDCSPVSSFAQISNNVVSAFVFTFTFLYRHKMQSSQATPSATPQGS